MQEKRFLASVAGRGTRHSAKESWKDKPRKKASKGPATGGGKRGKGKRKPKRHAESDCQVGAFSKAQKGQAYFSKERQRHG